MTSRTTTGMAGQTTPREAEARSYRPAPNPKVPGTKAKPTFTFTDWASI
ncbi:hypothetical protein CLV77_1927 [Brevirhabdus pacifica]|nr:hypothetical protein [Brevirhabdus pacifica]PJJ87359.1 hypothetical protein CLV77_1927 [Brevirhabdus pacifica]